MRPAVIWEVLVQGWARGPVADTEAEVELASVAASRASAAALHGHLQVVGKGTPPGQHLVGHDLCSELVQLVLVEGCWASVLLPQSLRISTI